MSSLRLYNTLTRPQRPYPPFIPIDPANVRMYVCGPTVYDYAHIGNARPIIVFDVLYRLLRHLAKQGQWDNGKGQTKITYVRNITDVDDKINARAAERGIDIRELTEGTARVFHEDVAALGCLPPDVEPRATEHIAEMIRIIETLIARGHAYAADGHVLFSVPSMPDYGRLSRRPLDEMIAGARVDVAPYKKGDTDFVLWKPSKESEPGWDSPWGRGRPGWHIECSAMSWKHLGETFDIHGGGIDLVFPHHENEIAQSRCAFGHDVMANVWMHNGFLQVEGEKMSKSAGNFVTIHELLNTDKFGGRRWPGDVLRLTMLRTNYRQPIDWTASSLLEHLQAWVSFGDVVRNHLPSDQQDEIFMDSLCNDLNTSDAITRLFALRDEALKGNDNSARKLRAGLEFMGLFSKFRLNFSLSYIADASGLSVQEIIPVINQQLNGDFEVAAIAANLSRHGDLSASIVGLLRKFISGTSVKDIDPKINWSNALEMDQSRLAARAAKNWAESDRIRDELAAMGIALKDNKDGTTTWEVKR